MNPGPMDLSPVGFALMSVHPEPERFAARPADGGEAEALLARMEAAPAALADAVRALDANGRMAVLQSALLWESWLMFALRQLEAGGRLKVGGNLVMQMAEPPSPETFVARISELRAQHVAAARAAGEAFWDRVADPGRTPKTAFQVLSAIAAADDERLAIVREEA